MGIGVLPPSTSQQTPAVRFGIAKAAGRRGGLRSAKRRRGSKKKAAAAPRARKAKAGKRYNSKAWMAKIRGMRGKKRK